MLEIFKDIGGHAGHQLQCINISDHRAVSALPEESGQSYSEACAGVFEL